MELKLLGSNSKGNCYILTNGSETLIIEAGVSFRNVKKALDFKIQNIVAVLISHEHNDHAGYVLDYAKAGIKVITSEQVIEAKQLRPKYSSMAKSVLPGKGYKIGNFKIIPFELNHDVFCLGFYINHPETGNILFMTDTYYCEYTFPNINHVLIECNYKDSIVRANVDNGRLAPIVYKRLLNTHLELETCKNILSANNLENCLNIVLIHLSDGNSDEKLFEKEIIALTGKKVYVGKKELSVNLSLSLF